MTQLLLSLFIAPCLGGCSEGPSGLRGEQGRGCWVWAGPRSPEEAAHGLRGPSSAFSDCAKPSQDRMGPSCFRGPPRENS